MCGGGGVDDRDDSGGLVRAHSLVVFVRGVGVLGGDDSHGDGGAQRDLEHEHAGRKEERVRVQGGRCRET